MLDNELLLDLPLESLMSLGCLLVVWVTNKHSNREFVTQKLFPRKDITFIATWYWLKVKHRYFSNVVFNSVAFNTFITKT